MNFVDELNTILAQHAGKRTNGKQASDRTITAITEGLRSNFRLLRNTLGYKVQDPRNIGETHIKALCQKWHAEGLAPKTMQGYLSHFRIFCGWIGKKGMVKAIGYYLPDVPAADLRVRTIAKKSKSWAESGIDVREKVKEAMGLDWRFGLMILTQVSFGFRRIEVIQFQPWKNHEGDKIHIRKTKGGRPRDIYIETDAQREILEFIKSQLKASEALGWTHRTDGSKASLKYSEGRYERLMAKIEITKEISFVTGHGLRAQFAENAALLRDFIPATLGGLAGQKPPHDIQVIGLGVSESLGHSRPSITSAYWGSTGRVSPPDGATGTAAVITACFKVITPDQLKSVSHERVATCSQLTAELMLIGVYDDPRKIQLLWEEHSGRHAVDWLAPEADTNIAALEVAARSLMRSRRSALQPTAGT